MKIPEYYTQHWKNGTPTGAWWLGREFKGAETVGEGFIVCHHPAQEIEVNDKMVLVERMMGLAVRFKEYKPPKKEPWWKFWRTA